MTNYRKIWEEANGPIPKDDQGRTYEIHHINGDNTDNRLENLECLSIHDHLERHKSQGDHCSAALIQARIDGLGFNWTVLNKARIGVPLSENQRKKIGNSHRGKKRPEHSAKMKVKMKGYRKSPEHEKKRAESWKKTTADKPIRSKTWKVLSPEGEIQITNLKGFCRKMNFKYTIFLSQRPYEGYQLLGRL